MNLKINLTKTDIILISVVKSEKRTKDRRRDQAGTLYCSSESVLCSPWGEQIEFLDTISRLDVEPAAEEEDVRLGLVPEVVLPARALLNTDRAPFILSHEFTLL